MSLLLIQQLLLRPCTILVLPYYLVFVSISFLVIRIQFYLVFTFSFVDWEKMQQPIIYLANTITELTQSYIDRCGCCGRTCSVWFVFTVHIISVNLA